MPLPHPTSHASPFTPTHTNIQHDRYTYGETFGRWKTVDLLIGLNYLCRKETDEHPIADIASQGRLYYVPPRPSPARDAALAELNRIRRFFRYCSGLRERRPIFQRRYFIETLDVPDHNILVQELRAGVLKPSYILTKDESLHSIILAIRGTHSFKDAFTSLTGASKPHHVVDSNGVVLGYSHFGMLAAARWLKGQVKAKIEEAVAANPGYKIYLVGHSLGGGTAAMLTMMLRESGGIFTDVECVAIACPACMTLELAKSCAGYVTTVVHGADVIPTISPGSADALRDVVAQSSWGRDFRQELRSSSIVRAVETGIRGMSSATSWTATRLSACMMMRSNRGDSGRKSINMIVHTDGNGDARKEEEEAMPSAAQQHQHKRKNSDVSVYDNSNDGHGGAGMSAMTRQRRASSLPNSSGGGGGGSEFSDSGPPTDTANGNDAHLPTSWSPPSTSTMMNGNAMFQMGSFGQLDNNDGGGGTDDFDDYDDDEDGMLLDTPASLLDQREEEALEAEATIRLREVAQAVSAAESEEANGMNAEVAVPSVFRPGQYGSRSSSGRTRLLAEQTQPLGSSASASSALRRTAPSSSTSHRPEDVAWRRMMYPAGRIMHLVPARLVPDLPPGWLSDAEDEDEGEGVEVDVAEDDDNDDNDIAEQGGTKREKNKRQQQQLLQQQRDREWPEALMEEGEDYPIPASPYPSSKNLIPVIQEEQEEEEGMRVGARGGLIQRKTSGSGFAGGIACTQPGIITTTTTTTHPSHPTHSRHVSELSFKDMITSEEAAGSAAPGGGGHVGPLPPLKPAIGPPPEQMVLLDHVPQEAYGRIKLCRTVLSDHVIPNYLRSLASFMDKL